MLSYREMMENIHFATKHGQKEVKISEQILLNIQVGKYTINSTRIILLRYVTGV